MANTSLTLGEHWEVFIKNQIASGKYVSASGLVRDGLRLLEQRETKLRHCKTRLQKAWKVALMKISAWINCKRNLMQGDASLPG
ncbi:MAG: type II toxin-antitoxin system ParD family antitoxin [Pseudomonadota bacterium]